MIRCALAAAIFAAALPALAQAPRTFPASALRGEMVVVQPPEILINGHPARLAPGARIFDTQGLLQLSGSLVGQRLLVHYTRDNAGQPHQVWILTPAERAREPWPVNDQELRSWGFDAAGQRWVKP